MKRTKFLLSVGLAVLGILLTRGAPNAAADTVYDFTLSVGNTAISGYPAGYVDVHINLDSTGTVATITFTSQTTGGYTYLMGDGSSVAVNVNATSWTLSGISGSGLAGFTPGAYSDGGSLNVDGFNVFNQTIDDFDGFTHSATSVTFTLTNTSGTWADASNVLIANANGNLAAAHIFVCDASSGPCTTTGGALATGFASNGNPVPEPASLALFGTGLLGLGAKLRRRLVKK